jgi:hypothetical protein
MLNNSNFIIKFLVQLRRQLSTFDSENNFIIFSLYISKISKSKLSYWIFKFLNILIIQQVIMEATKVLWYI